MRTRDRRPVRPGVRREGPLGGDGAAHGRGRGRERDEVGVALGAERDAALRLDGVEDEPPLRGEERLVGRVADRGRRAAWSPRCR